MGEQLVIEIMLEQQQRAENDESEAADFVVAGALAGGLVF